MHATVRRQKRPVMPSISRKDYRSELRILQLELVKLQRHSIRCGDRILVLLEGRDAAGKDGSIKRIVEHLSPRETRVVALGKPSDRERSGWYAQRYGAHLPIADELVVAVALKRCNAYSAARDAMPLPAHSAVAPWRIVRAGDKRLARLSMMSDILSRLHYAGKRTRRVQPDPDIAFAVTTACIDGDRLAR